MHVLIKAEELDGGECRELRDILARLHAVLWTPVAVGCLPDDPGQPVTVVPHGITLRVPFSALIGVEGEALGTRYTIEVAPALALLAEPTT